MNLIRLAAASALLFASTAYAESAATPAPMPATGQATDPSESRSDFDVELFLESVEKQGDTVGCAGGPNGDAC